MVYFGIELINRESRESLYLRKLTAWPMVPRVGEKYLPDKMAEFESVIKVWHYAEHVPSYISIVLEVNPYVFDKLCHSPNWTLDQSEFWKSLE